MDVGLALPQYDYSRGNDWTDVAAAAARAESCGFDSVWLAGHLFMDIDKYGAPEGHHFGYDPLIALAALARTTTRVKLGTLVICSQLRPPTVLAKSLATLDVLSNGRLVVGMGAGWNAPEYDVAGIPFERPGVRLAQLAEAVQIVRGMCGGGPFSFDGEHYVANHAYCRPPAVQQPSPPIVVGGRGDRLLELCARHADGWNTVWTWTVDAWQERSAFVDAACERVGRDPATLRRSLGLYALVGEDARDLRRRWERLRDATPPGVLDGVDLDAWRAGHLVGTVDEVRAQVDAWAEAGVDELVVSPAALPFALASLDDVDVLAAGCTLATQ
jgi:probable F420-dependent oxidoreductase